MDTKVIAMPCSFINRIYDALATCGGSQSSAGSAAQWSVKRQRRPQKPMLVSEYGLKMVYKPLQQQTPKWLPTWEAAVEAKHLPAALVLTRWLAAAHAIHNGFTAIHGVLSISLTVKVFMVH